MTNNNTYINDPSDIIIVNGNNTLRGSVNVSGAKNSALKLIAASILGSGKTTITNVPNISDIEIMCKVLNSLGAKIERKNDAIHIDTACIDKVEASYNLVSKMRASIAVLGPLIARFGHAKVAMPGGCQIGARKIDMHLVGLKRLGVNFEVDHGYLVADTPNGLHGTSITLEFASVGATENILMAACVANGVTVIDNAAREPEIVDLCNMLNEMGADIQGGGTSTIVIRGVSLDSMHPCNHTTCPDRIEAGTYIVGGALTGGPLTVNNINPSFLKTFLMKLKDMGVHVECTDNSITVSRDLNSELKPIEIQTLPHPGFPTDLQAQLMLLATQAKGKSIITENVFENRFMFAEEIIRMGANITLEGHHAIVDGPTQLLGAPVSSTDLRAGASLVLAGIIAEGLTYVMKVGHIDRGYEYFCEKLRNLGADVKRVHESELS